MKDPREDFPLTNLHALLDGELDAAGAAEAERRIAADPALAKEYERMSALMRAVREAAPRDRAPESLRARVAELSGATPARRAAPSWRVLGGSMAAAVALAFALGRLTGGGAETDELRAAVYNHMRAQLAAQPTDVASGDRHAVKPWFASKLPLATAVIDLAPLGFPLAGGRIDIVEGAAAPTLVYKRREHLISLTELPFGGGDGAPRRTTRNGYSVIVWTRGGREFVVVSDLAPGELDAFVAAFREALARESEERRP
jgi:anti-sigma factor RsiW